MIFISVKDVSDKSSLVSLKYIVDSVAKTI